LGRRILAFGDGWPLGQLLWAGSVASGRIRRWVNWAGIVAAVVVVAFVVEGMPFGEWLFRQGPGLR